MGIGRARRRKKRRIRRDNNWISKGLDYPVKSEIRALLTD